MSVSVAIQGTIGSFHDQAARKFFGDNYIPVAKDTFRDVFDAVNNGTAMFGVVAIENSLHGSINPVYRLLTEQKLWVCGEVRLHIELFLIGTKHTKDVRAIKKVLSQSEAISQCEYWLKNNLPLVDIEESYDTAGSVEIISARKDHSIASIAGKTAAKIYNAKILEGPINDDPDNYTRFYILCKIPQKNDLADRTSIIITEKATDKPGSLYEALGVFASLGINLSKIDSHTLPGKQRKYAFYIDFDESLQVEQSQSALEKLQTHGWLVQVLGTYQKSEH